MIDIFSSFAENLLKVRIDEVGMIPRLYEEDSGNKSWSVVLEGKHRTQFLVKIFGRGNRDPDTDFMLGCLVYEGMVGC